MFRVKGEGEGFFSRGHPGGIRYTRSMGYFADVGRGVFFAGGTLIQNSVTRGVFIGY